ncbi:hypothetical protein AVEN_88366-1 [Araneus ventricosus]|uniref:Uncharacterized protein n=1 Tax=Araneus ventricosus TaxID=182803 RepID=A0A4Y2IBU8_ARAVE|nr:hypothetical protein AVEN_88366-1 [Araneus ventricosus]
MEAPLHLDRTISFSRYLSNELKKTGDATIQRIGSFAQPEIILIAKLTDKGSHIRKMGMRRILSENHDNHLSVSLKYQKLISVLEDCADLYKLVTT